MAPPYTLRFGALDLAPYLRIGNDEGFDPYDGGGFEEPAFIDNPFGEGQGLANVDSRNREMSWPLYLNASSKDGLHSLVRQINQEIRYAARPLRVEWRDQDASASTFYDVEFARFDPNFRMRPSAQKWLAGTLRVWTKPYGHTATSRGLASVAGSRIFATMALPSVAGDVDALMNVTLGFGDSTATAAHDGIALGMVSVLPYGWNPAYLPASISLSGAATLMGASGAIASQANRYFFAPGASSYRFVGGFQFTASALQEPHRIFAVLRGTVPTPVLFTDVDTAGVGLGPIRTATTGVLSLSATAWRLFDIGRAGGFDPSETLTMYELYGGPIGSAAASSVLDVAAIFVVPEERTVYYNDSSQPTTLAGNATLVLDGITSKTFRLQPAGYEVQRRDDYLRGNVPNIVPGASQSMFSAVMMQGSRTDTRVSVGVSVRERFTFAR